MNEINVGLLGFGLAGQVFHAPLIQACEGLKLAAIGSRTFDGKSVPGGVKTAIMDEVIDDPDIDLIVVATPNTSHFPLTCRALSAGKHVVVDKPFAVEIDEADTMIKLARENGLMLSVYQNRRWDAGFLTAKQVIASGDLGDISFAELHFDRFSPAVNTRWREQPAPGAGNLFDLGSHLIDQTYDLFGTPFAVTADVTAQREGALVDDYFHIILDYGKLRVVAHATSLSYNYGPRISLHGDQACFQYFGLDNQEDDLVAGLNPNSAIWGRTDGSKALILNPEGDANEIPSLAGSYEAYYQGVAEAIQNGGAAPVLADDARDTLAIIKAAEQSSKDGRRVSLLA